MRSRGAISVQEISVPVVELGDEVSLINQWHFWLWSLDIDKLSILAVLDFFELGILLPALSDINLEALLHLVDGAVWNCNIQFHIDACFGVLVVHISPHVYLRVCVLLWSHFLFPGGFRQLEDFHELLSSRVVHAGKGGVHSEPREQA